MNSQLCSSQALWETPLEQNQDYLIHAFRIVLSQENSHSRIKPK